MFDNRTAACKEENGYLVVGTHGMFTIWRNHFRSLLNGVSTEEFEPEIPAIDDRI